MDAGVNVVKFLTKHAQLKAQYKKTIISPKAATRNTRGPVFFKFVRVEYDKENGRLKLSDGEFAGRLVNAEERGGEKDKAEYAETVVEMEKEDIDFPGKILTRYEDKSMNCIFLMTIFLCRLTWTIARYTFKCYVVCRMFLSDYFQTLSSRSNGIQIILCH